MNSSLRLISFSGTSTPLIFTVEDGGDSFMGSDFYLNILLDSVKKAPIDCLLPPRDCFNASFASFSYRAISSSF